MNQEDKTWAGISHFGAILFGFLAPLIAYLVMKDKSSFVKAHAAQSLFFTLGLLVAYIILGITVVGVILMPILWIAQIVLAIMAGMKALNGEMYSYPLTGKFAENSGLMRS
ncbi:MAG: DUF4870 domain-containing protein [Fimbriimonadaceae bacterium]|jgi:hypothetical protein|nr:DUF4870 domain-containing protein [Fimbriimonadaceae bacterium]